MLGNSSSSAQSGGKQKAVRIKKIKEWVAAKAAAKGGKKKGK